MKHVNTPKHSNGGEAVWLPEMTCSDDSPSFPDWFARSIMNCYQKHSSVKILKFITNLRHR